MKERQNPKARVDCLSREFVAHGIFGALVQDHEDVAPEGELHVHGGLGSERVRVAIQMRVEDHAVFGDLANSGQAEHLESSGVGEDGVGPGHEAVQSAQPLNQLVAGAKVEVIRVAEQNTDVEILGEVALGESFDGGLGAHGHKHGRRDIAMPGM